MALRILSGRISVGAALVGQALVKNRQLGFIALSYPWERNAEEEDEEDETLRQSRRR